MDHEDYESLLLLYKLTLTATYLGFMLMCTYVLPVMFCVIYVIGLVMFLTIGWTYLPPTWLWFVAA